MLLVRLLLLLTVGSLRRLLSERLLLAHLVTLHRSGLLIHMLLLAHGLGGGEGHALAGHLTLLLLSGGRGALHEQALHHLLLLLTLARVHETSSAMARR